MLGVWISGLAGGVGIGSPIVLLFFCGLMKGITNTPVSSIAKKGSASLLEYSKFLSEDIYCGNYSCYIVNLQNV